MSNLSIEDINNIRDLIEQIKVYPFIDEDGEEFYFYDKINETWVSNE
jgi:hypothetical protein